MVNHLRFLAFGFMYKTQKAISLTELEFLGVETDCTECGVFGGVKLVVIVQHNAKGIQRSCLTPRVTELPKDPRCFPHLLYPPFVET